MTPRKHRTVKTGHKKKPRKPATVKTKTTPKVVPVAPAKTGSPGLRSRISSVFKVSLIAMGMLLLALAALEPRLVRPLRLRKALIDHRGDLAAAGILLLVGVGIAYLIVWGTAV